MKIYISGISGTGMGPLALMAKEAGMEVVGSDLARGAIYDELIRTGIEVSIGKQDGEFLKKELDGLDWFVYTSALPDEHPELKLAREAGVKCTKRDDFTAFLVKNLGLKMVAVAGTHGKTTTTAMIVFAALELGLPVSYVVGTTLGFAPSGNYRKGDKYFVYEADESDRNFLKYRPWLAAETFVSYDHPDIYPTEKDYRQAFLQFEQQSEMVIHPSENTERFELAGAVRRADADLALQAISKMAADNGTAFDESEIINILNKFPGVGRRFERLAEGIYSDYAHHPEEIAATMEVAQEQAKMDGRKGVVVVYQPHQNTRQHKVRAGYRGAFDGAEKVFWLPTYLTREDPNLAILTPEDLYAGIGMAETAQVSNDLFEDILKWRDAGYLMILMTAGPADEWLREKLGA